MNNKIPPSAIRARPTNPHPSISHTFLTAELSKLIEYIEANATTYIARLSEAVAIDSVSSDDKRRQRVS